MENLSTVSDSGHQWEHPQQSVGCSQVRANGLKRAFPWFFLSPSFPCEFFEGRGRCKTMDNHGILKLWKPCHTAHRNFIAAVRFRFWVFAGADPI